MIMATVGTILGLKKLTKMENVFTTPINDDDAKELTIVTTAAVVSYAAMNAIEACNGIDVGLAYIVPSIVYNAAKGFWFAAFPTAMGYLTTIGAAITFGFVRR